MRRSKSISAIATLVAATALALGAHGAASSTQSHQNTLAGTWSATVNRPAPLPPLQSLQIFTGTGSAIETSDEWPPARSPLYASWERIGGRLYAASGVHFLFNPQTGQYLGKRKIDRTIRLSADGQSFSAVARVTTFDPAGNIVGSGTAISTAERMPVDRIPDLPPQ